MSEELTKYDNINKVLKSWKDRRFLTKVFHKGFSPTPRKGIKRKRIGSRRNISKCLKKNEMGAGCGKYSGKHVINPIKISKSNDSTTPQAQQSYRSNKDYTALKDYTNVHNGSDIKAEDNIAIVHNPENEDDDVFKKPSNSKNSKSASSVRETIKDVKSNRGRKENELHGCRSTSTGDLTRSCSYENTSLKHYGGSTNLLDIESVRLSSSRTTRSETKIDKVRSSSVIESGGNLPPIPPRLPRQPPFENSVCFQEEDQVNCYKICKEIGRGSYGSVYKCLSLKDNNYYAMKVISKKRLIKKNGLMARHPRKKVKSNPLDGLHKEIAILKKVDHPNVMKMIEVIDDPEVDNVYMVFEIMDRGTVLEIPTDDALSEDQVWPYFRDMLLGIEYLHHTKIIHRDIKPSNLLLSNDNTVKIADFGVSDIFEGEDDTLNRFAGSPAFQAPEAIAGNRNKFSGKAADVWAMGITLYSLIYGKCPFYDKDILKLYEVIKTESVLFPDEPLVDPQFHDLISRMLAKDPNQRITVENLKEHPWVTKGGKELLPSTQQHCTVIEVSEEDLKNSITLISRLSSLVLVKSMLSRRAFGIANKNKSTIDERSNSDPDITHNAFNTAHYTKRSTSTIGSK